MKIIKSTYICTHINTQKYEEPFNAELHQTIYICSGIGVGRKRCKLRSGSDSHWSWEFLYEDREVGAMNRTVGNKFSNLTS